MTNKPTNRKISHAKLASTMALFWEQPHVTAAQLREKINVHAVTAAEWLRALRLAGTIHICRWLPDSLGRDATPVYKLGPGEDAPRRSKTRAQIMREYRQRKKKELT